MAAHTHNEESTSFHLLACSPTAGVVGAGSDRSQDLGTPFGCPVWVEGAQVLFPTLLSSRPIRRALGGVQGKLATGCWGCTWLLIMSGHHVSNCAHLDLWTAWQSFPTAFHTHRRHPWAHTRLYFCFLFVLGAIFYWFRRLKHRYSLLDLFPGSGCSPGCLRD